MDISGIPYRTLNTPFLTIPETNAILDNLHRPVYSPNSISTSLGSIAYNTNNPDRGINIKFAADVEPRSVFAVKFTDVIHSPLVAMANADLAVEYQNLKHNAAFIFCTNGEVKVPSGATIDCEILGFNKPVLCRYSSTSSVPTIGSRLRVKGSPDNAFYVNTGGEFVAVSLPNTTLRHVYVVRQFKLHHIRGKAAGDITYGTFGTMNIWRNRVITNPLETETVWFDWEGIAGQVIPAGAKMTAVWEDDVQNGAGGYGITNSNCVAS